MKPLLLFAAICAGSATAEVARCKMIIADGRTLEGSIAGVTPGQVIRFNSQAQVVAVPGEKILSLEWARQGPVIDEDFQGAIVTLHNGDRFKGILGPGRGQAIEIQSKTFGALRVNLRDIKSIVIETSKVSPDARDKFRQVASRTQPSADTIILPNGDSLPVEVRGFKEKELDVQTEFGALSVGFNRVYAVFLVGGPRNEQEKQLLAVVDTREGEVLTGIIKDWNDHVFTIATLGGQAVKAPEDDLQRIFFKNGAVVFLSDLEPEKVVETPFFDKVFPYKKDRSQSGNPIRIGGKTYSKGLGVHSRCELTYLLDGKYSRFLCHIGIDDEVGAKGNATFRVLADGKELFSKEEVRGGEPPLPLDLDVSRVKRLTLLVDFGKGYHIADHADWADARLLKAE